MYKLLTSTRGYNNLSIGFARDNIDPSTEGIVNFKFHGKLQLRILLKNVFSFAEKQQNAISGLVYKSIS